LEAAGYVAIHKAFVGKKPRTYLSLTVPGREAFGTYHEQMRELFAKPPGGTTDTLAQ
jgi:DNA-binding PadR family transcriptional regulator